MTEKDIIDAWAKIRKIDNTIPDDVLDFMKDCAIDRLKGDDGPFPKLPIIAKNWVWMNPPLLP